MSHSSTLTPLSQRCPNNPTHIACPHVASDKTVSGWYKFNDNSLSPEVLYGSWPPQTTLKLGGRTMTVERPVTLKLRLLEPDEDRYGWTQKPQHEERVNLGEYHVDFADTEVAYSISKPQTHIWLCGYAIHMDELEKLTFTSYNVTVRIAPSALPAAQAQGGLPPKKPGEQGMPQAPQQAEHYESGRFGAPALPWSPYAGWNVGYCVPPSYPYRQWDSMRYPFYAYPAGPLRMNSYHNPSGHQSSAIPGLGRRKAAAGHSGFPCINNFSTMRALPMCARSVDCKSSRMPGRKTSPTPPAPRASCCRSPSMMDINRPGPYTVPKKTSKRQNCSITHPFTVQAPTYVAAPCGTGSRMARYHFTATPLNDCERIYQIRDTYDVEVNVGRRASPTSQLPLFPPPLPYQVPEWVTPARQRAGSVGNAGRRKHFAYSGTY